MFENLLLEIRGIIDFGVVLFFNKNIMNLVMLLVLFKI